jgi:hypothetical protein
VRCIVKEDKMLFMSIFTFGAANREAIIRRHALGENKVPNGVQVHVEVVDLSKNRIFRIFDATDPKAILESNLTWNDLGEIETVPVMETEEVLETLDRAQDSRQFSQELADSLELASLT